MRIQDRLADMIDEAGKFDEVKIRQEANVHFKRELMLYLESGLGILESIAAYCEDNDIETEDIVSYIDQNLLSDLTEEVSARRLLKKSHRVNRAIELT